MSDTNEAFDNNVALTSNAEMQKPASAQKTKNGYYIVTNQAGQRLNKKDLEKYQNKSADNTAIEVKYVPITSQEEIAKAKTGGADYIVQNTDLNLGAAEFLGVTASIEPHMLALKDNNPGKPQQQDQISFGKLSDFHNLSSDDKKKQVLKSTIEAMQAMHGQERLYNDPEIDDDPKAIKHVGSTAIACVTEGKKIYTVNVGDSTAYLIIRKKNGQLECRRLNTLLHNPNEDIERLSKEGYAEHINKEHNKLHDKIRVSRAIGDRHVEQYGLSHTPNIYVDNFELEEGDTAYLVVACDGLTEQATEAQHASDEDYVKAFFQKALETAENEAELAASLSKQALEDGTTDNVSVVVKKIDIAQQNAEFTAVYDGHGGKEVSHALANEQNGLLATLQRFIKLHTLIIKNNPNPSQAIITHLQTLEGSFTKTTKKITPGFNIEKIINKDDISELEILLNLQIYFEQSKDFAGQIDELRTQLTKTKEALVSCYEAACNAIEQELEHLQQQLTSIKAKVDPATRQALEIKARLLQEKIEILKDKYPPALIQLLGEKAVAAETKLQSTEAAVLKIPKPSTQQLVKHTLLLLNKFSLETLEQHSNNEKLKVLPTDIAEFKDAVNALLAEVAKQSGGVIGSEKQLELLAKLMPENIKAYGGNIKVAYNKSMFIYGVFTNLELITQETRSSTNLTTFGNIILNISNYIDNSYPATPTEIAAFIKKPDQNVIEQAKKVEDINPHAKYFLAQLNLEEFREIRANKNLKITPEKLESFNKGMKALQELAAANHLRAQYDIAKYTAEGHITFHGFNLSPSQEQQIVEENLPLAAQLFRKLLENAKKDKKLTKEIKDYLSSNKDLNEMTDLRQYAKDINHALAVIGNIGSMYNSYEQAQVLFENRKNANFTKHMFNSKPSSTTIYKAALNDHQAAKKIFLAKTYTKLENKILDAKQIVEILAKHADEKGFLSDVFKPLVGSNIDLVKLSKQSASAFEIILTTPKLLKKISKNHLVEILAAHQIKDKKKILDIILKTTELHQKIGDKKLLEIAKNDLLKQDKDNVHPFTLTRWQIEQAAAEKSFNLYLSTVLLYAKAGSPKARYYLAVLYDIQAKAFGDENLQERSLAYQKQSLEYLEQAAQAEQGPAEAKYDLAKHYIEQAKQPECTNADELRAKAKPLLEQAKATLDPNHMFKDKLSNEITALLNGLVTEPNNSNIAKNMSSISLR